LRSRRSRRRRRFGRTLFKGPVVEGGKGGHFPPRSDRGQHAVVVLNVVVVVAAVVVVGYVVRNWALARITVVRLMVSGVSVVCLRAATSHF